MTAKQAEVCRAYGIEPPYAPDEVYPPPTEIFPDKPAWIVREEAGRRILEAMPWGVPTQVPGKRIDKTTGQPAMLTKAVTNVRNLNSPFWRSMLADPARRCLVPFTSFSEYGQVRGSDGKLPLHWFTVPSRPIVSFAGIWRPTAAGLRFAFLTCAPNPIVAPIHPKAMPVLLHEEDEERWLRDETAEACALAAPYPSQLMEVA